MAYTVVAYYVPRTSRAAWVATQQFIALDQSDPAAQDAAQSSIVRNIHRIPWAPRSTLLNTYSWRSAYDQSDPAAQDSPVAHVLINLYRAGKSPRLAFLPLWTHPAFDDSAAVIQPDTAWGVPGLRLTQPYSARRVLGLWNDPAFDDSDPAAQDSAQGMVPGLHLSQPYSSRRAVALGSMNHPPGDDSAPVVTPSGGPYIPTWRRRRR